MPADMTRASQTPSVGEWWLIKTPLARNCCAKLGRLPDGRLFWNMEDGDMRLLEGQCTPVRKLNPWEITL